MAAPGTDCGDEAENCGRIARRKVRAARTQAGMEVAMAVLVSSHRSSTTIVVTVFGNRKV